VHEAVVALVTSDAFRLARTTATTTDTGADR
jgi:HJR/Mrr/RecB family endonuclease